MCSELAILQMKNKNVSALWWTVEIIRMLLNNCFKYFGISALHICFTYQLEVNYFMPHNLFFFVVWMSMSRTQYNLLTYLKCMISVMS